MQGPQVNSDTMNSRTVKFDTEAQTTTRSLRCCQNQELLELLEIHAEHVQQAKPAARWVKRIQSAFKPQELPGTGRMTLVFAALCTLVVAGTLLAMMMI